MNLEMIMTSLIGSAICMVFIMYSGQIIMEEKLNIKKNLIYMILYIIFLTLNFYMEDRILKTFSACVIMIIFYKLCFNKNWVKSTIGVILLYAITQISELIYAIVITVIFSILKLSDLGVLNNTIFLNAIIAILVITLTNLFKKKLISVMRNSVKYEDKNIPIIFVILIISFTMILNHLNIKNWKFDLDFYINIILFISLTSIFIFALSQKYQNNKAAGKYKQLQNYSKLTDEVLEEYRIKNHEYKNQLVIIKSLVSKENRELNEYVNNLIKNQKNMKYSWINQVKYINLSGLKGLLNYKITEFNSLNINTNIVVSKSLEEISFEKRKIIYTQ